MKIDRRHPIVWFVSIGQPFWRRLDRPKDWREETRHVSLCVLFWSIVLRLVMIGAVVTCVGMLAWTIIHAVWVHWTAILAFLKENARMFAEAFGLGTVVVIATVYRRFWSPLFPALARRISNLSDKIWESKTFELVSEGVAGVKERFCPRIEIDLSE